MKGRTTKKNTHKTKNTCRIKGCDGECIRDYQGCDKNENRLYDQKCLNHVKWIKNRQIGTTALI